MVKTHYDLKKTWISLITLFLVYSISCFITFNTFNNENNFQSYFYNFFIIFGFQFFAFLSFILIINVLFNKVRNTNILKNNYTNEDKIKFLLYETKIKLFYKIKPVFHIKHYYSIKYFLLFLNAIFSSFAIFYFFEDVNNDSYKKTTYFMYFSLFFINNFIGLNIFLSIFIKPLFYIKKRKISNTHTLYMNDDFTLSIFNEKGILDSPYTPALIYQLLDKYHINILYNKEDINPEFIENVLNAFEHKCSWFFNGKGILIDNELSYKQIRLKHSFSHF